MNNTNLKKSKKSFWVILSITIISIQFLIMIVVGVIINNYNVNTQMLGTAFSLEITDVSDEIVSWINQCDNNGNGTYVLKLSHKKADQLIFANETDEIPEDTYCVYIYINNFKRKGVKKEPVGRAVTKGNIIEVSYNSGYMLDDDLPDYQLSEISAVGYKASNLKILIDGEEVEYSMKELK